MPGAGDTTESYLRGPGSPWLLLVLGAVWAAVLILVVVWGFTAGRERRQRGSTPAAPRSAARRPRHAATGRAAGSAVSVREIAQRLDREAAARARRPPRRVAVIHRKAPPPDSGPGTRFPAPEETTRP